MIKKKVTTLRTNAQPPTVSCGLAITSTNSGLIQLYDTAKQEYSPNRTLMPLIIQPKVQAFCMDGSMAPTQINRNIGNVSWKIAEIGINGKTTISKTSFDTTQQKFLGDNNLVLKRTDNVAVDYTFTNDKLKMQKNVDYCFEIPTGKAVSAVKVTGYYGNNTANRYGCVGKIGDKVFCESGEYSDYLFVYGNANSRTYSFSFDSPISNELHFELAGDGICYISFEIIFYGEDVWQDITAVIPTATVANSTDDERGKLTIPANLPAGSVYRIRFNAVYPFKGTNIPIESDVMVLATQEKVLDEYRLYTEDDLNVIFNPFIDPTYYRMITFKVHLGKSIVTTGSLNGFAALRIYRNGVLMNAYGTDFIKKVEQLNDCVRIFLNMGYALRGRYDIKLENIKNPDKPIVYDVRSLSIARLSSKYDIKQLNRAPYEEDKERPDACIVTVGNDVIEDPLRFINIDWWYSNAAESNKVKFASNVTSKRFTPSTSIVGVGADTFTQWFEAEDKVGLDYKFIEDKPLVIASGEKISNLIMTNTIEKLTGQAFRSTSKAVVTMTDAAGYKDLTFVYDDDTQLTLSNISSYANTAIGKATYCNLTFTDVYALIEIDAKATADVSFKIKSITY